MELREKITDFSLRHYKLITAVMVVFTLALGALIPRMKVDTDPENMLSEDEPVRVFHDATKKRFALSDIVVVGIVNNEDPNGVFNPGTLRKVYELTQFAKSLTWPDPEDANRSIGVVEVDLLAPSTVDYIGQGGPGEIRFEWLMRKPPTTQAEATEIHDKAMSNPLLVGTLFADETANALCLYLPLTSKDLSYKVYSMLREKTAQLGGPEQYYVTGLPVAEDTFGVEMFIQMAISAPLAMVVIFILMLVFIRKLVLVISPMIVAMVSVISTMGLLIGLGYPVHIMSSMIPIFLMPIAVVDSVHILSEFFDLYTKAKGRKGTITEVMSNLFVPMLYTSLTSAAGFASLALTPIPPVQVFGIFVAIGIMIAWVFTVAFVPAYVMMISDKSLENFGREVHHADKPSWLSRLLDAAGRFTYSQAKAILLVVLIITAVAIYGITRINVNDNPVKWFSKRHPIRQADDELNKHFGGTYMAYLVLDANESRTVVYDYISDLRECISDKGNEFKAKYPKAVEVAAQVEGLLLEGPSGTESKGELLDKLAKVVEEKAASSEGKEADVWYEFVDFLEEEKERVKPFKQPEVLRYITRLQAYLKDSKLVGKSNSVADVVKKVHQELIDGTRASYRIPDSSAAVAQCLLQFQSSHNPDDLWHLVTYDYMGANIWLQLTSGDNKDMEKVVRAVDRFFKENPPPVSMTYNWAGLTYINTVWQDRMVWGMLQSFLGSFLIVFIMMAILFRSPLWGLVCMIPLLITIVFIYGIIGLVGKDYDMPVAVLSALTLGMAVDFAIHFLERARVSYAETGSWKVSAAVMFTEPARAISRNVLVIAIGFLPLLAAPLVPYKTVGIFLCAIMGLSGAVTLLVLPAVLKLAERPLFKPSRAPMTPSCNCGLCLAISAATVLLVSINLHQYWNLGWNKLGLIIIIAIPLTGLSCGIVSRRQACKAAGTKETKTKGVSHEC
ncbi:MAG TPA: MMPL family transporter [Sedimentisphaerales bacterium]|nr:MMPL family transporter [Sedimentisphaerales bacterium]